jgi:hypothetical protein
MMRRSDVSPRHILHPVTNRPIDLHAIQEGNEEEPPTEEDTDNNKEEQEEYFPLETFELAVLASRAEISDFCQTRAERRQPGAGTNLLRLERRIHNLKANDFNFPTTQAESTRLQRAREGCCVCLHTLTSPWQTTCGHIGCGFCMLKWVLEEESCPMCMKEVG